MKYQQSYAIDVGNELLVCIKDELARFVARAVGSRHIHNSTAYRWALKGIRGLRLPTVRIGGQLYTSPGAFSWWSQRLAEQLGEPPEGEDTDSNCATSEAALEVLRRAGIK